MIAGIIIDLIVKKQYEENEIDHMCEHDKCHCEDGIVKPALRHTINITFFIFIITLILTALIEFIGEENISNLVLNKPILGPIVAGIVGLIPNCAASVIIVELYVDQMISAGTMIAGLLVGAGVGLLVLFKENRHIKENVKIISILYGIGVICGIFLELLGLTL